ncbi:MAG TPA: DUF4157 domain-containing protein, partial [Acidimicrobiales bacterium]|nr:DUF4157 domain-containing protein [Acidimicrobiales bacterium]
GADGGALDAGASRDIDTARRGGASLEATTRSLMEAAYGADLSTVRLHADRRAVELCDRVQAQAFTVGSDIFFRRGRPDTSQPAGRHLLAHELAHVAQRSSPHEVRRTYLDGQHDWMADSERTDGPTGPVKPRSEEMLAVDAQVANTRLLYPLGNLPVLESQLGALLDTIFDWQRSKTVPWMWTRLRAQHATTLRQQTRVLLTRVHAWQDREFRKTVAAHRDQRVKAKDWLLAGRRQTTDIRLRNACEWLRSDKVRFYILTATADSPYRVQVNNPPTHRPDPTVSTYFPDPTKPLGALYQDAVQYNPIDASDTTNVVVHKTISGWDLPGRYLVLTDLQINLGRAAFLQTVRHEVQHEADKHTRPELTAGIREAGTDEARRYTEALRKYKTEYRAHSYQAEPALDRLPHLEAPPIRALAFDWTERQWAIFDRIRTRYTEVGDAWGPGPAATTAAQQQFRVAVNAYENADTEGFNKYDSVRVDDLYRALDEVPPGASHRSQPLVAAALQAFDALDPDDVAYVQDGDEAVMLRQKIKARLPRDALDEINRRFRLRPPRPRPRRGSARAAPTTATPPPPPPAPTRLRGRTPAPTPTTRRRAKSAG